MGFELTVESAPGYLVRRGLVPAGAVLTAEALPGGVSASVIAIRGAGCGFVAKQALGRLRVRDEWLAKRERTETEVAAMRLCAGLTPGCVPRVLDSDPAEHAMVMELVAPAARNWQQEVAAGRVHAGAGHWAGETLGTWHAGTASECERFDDFEAFEQLRLRPFHETVMRRLPELGEAIAPQLVALRADRRCLVHGDYSLKNMLIGPPGRYVLDFEVAHYGNPVFDLGFFLSFVVLSAVRWPVLAPELEALGASFLEGYGARAGAGFAGDDASVAAHTACLVLARTDGTSPAQFLDPPSRERAREVGIAMLREPARGLWSWV